LLFGPSFLRWRKCGGLHRRFGLGSGFHAFLITVRAIVYFFV
jgi:hypothetical protein